MLTIIDETPDYIVVVKPPNIPVQSTRRGNPGFISQIEDYLEFKRGIENPYIGLVHRLDQPTGGIMVFSKNAKTTAELNHAFSSRKVSKTYLCLVHGSLHHHAQLTHFLSSDAKKNWVTCSDHPHANSKKATLKYQVLLEDTLSAECASLVQVTLETGRQHQIRSQFSHIGHPLYGDQKYGQSTGKQALMLWSHSLSFEFNKKTVSFTAPPTIDPLKTWYASYCEHKMQ